MKLPSKAVIYSLFIFPGAGYFIIKKKLQAYLSLSVTLVCLSLILYDANHKAQIIAKALSDEIIKGNFELDILTIMEKIQSTQGFFSEQVINIITATIICVWIIGVVDVYRIARSNREMC